MTISQRIFAILKEKNIKQKELSQKSNISEAAISDWKKKGTNPAAENLSAIANALGVSLDYLITGKENTIPPYNIVTRELTKSEQELLSLFNQLSDDEKQREIGRMEVMTEFHSSK